MSPTFAALFGAVLGGALSVLASWLAQRVQAKAQWLSQEISRRQQLYSEFVDTAARCFADALQHDEPNAVVLAKFYGDIGSIRLQSSEEVIREARRIAQKILNTYGEANRNGLEIRELLAQNAIDLFSDFGDACRFEFRQLQPQRIGTERLSFRVSLAAS